MEWDFACELADSIRCLANAKDPIFVSTYLTCSARFVMVRTFIPQIHGDEDKNYVARVYRLNPGEYCRSASQSTAIFGS